MGPQGLESATETDTLEAQAAVVRMGEAVVGVSHVRSERERYARSVLGLDGV
jgi:hypothetical protein